MRKGMLFLALLALLAMSFKETAYACTHPDCLPPGVERYTPRGPNGTGH